MILIEMDRSRLSVAKGGDSLKALPISHLATLDFHVQDISVYAPDISPTTEQKSISQDLLLFVASGRKQYATERESIAASEGMLLLIPRGTDFFSQPADSDEPCQEMVVCFRLFDKDNEEILLEPGIHADRSASFGATSELFEELIHCIQENPNHIIKHKTLLLRILSLMIFGNEPKHAAKSMVSPALSFILQHYCENLPVKVYADQRHMSESYFRKKFVEFVGKSPLEYRNELRFAKARKMHAEGYSMHEIADSVGFFDTNYFSKLYKKRHGHSLREEKDETLSHSKNI